MNRRENCSISDLNMFHEITLEFLDKKHVKFDQGLDFLICLGGNRGKNQEKK